MHQKMAKMYVLKVDFLVGFSIKNPPKIMSWTRIIDRHFIKNRTNMETWVKDFFVGSASEIDQRVMRWGKHFFFEKLIKNHALGRGVFIGC